MQCCIRLPSSAPILISAFSFRGTAATRSSNPCASSFQKRWPVRRMKTSSSVGLLTLTESISPGNASTTSVMKRWPASRSMRTRPSSSTAAFQRRSVRGWRQRAWGGSWASSRITSPPISLFSCAGVPRPTRLPWLRMASRSHFSASSIRCVVTITVTPSCRAAVGGIARDRGARPGPGRCRLIQQQNLRDGAATPWPTRGGAACRRKRFRRGRGRDPSARPAPASQPRASSAPRR
jgi:hypothetical protein